ncbi:S1C family serine protease [Tomitella biformata]|uniref:S1C family serine protease n=1 Tax=Tomitella biformata TaxID=630403 RepID=UPI000466F0EC|nr:trypsin-like peptidase domain-containing protein [Tomitella biformata]
MSDERNPYGNPGGQNPGGHQPTQGFPAQPSPQYYGAGQPPAGYPPTGQPPTGPPSHGGAQGPAPQPPKRRPGAAILVGGALAFLLVGGAAGGAVGGYVASQNSGTSTVQMSNGTSVHAQPAATAPGGSVQSVATKVLPSVVDIQVKAQGGGGEGSGIVLTADGYILTNNHVASADGRGAVEMQVSFSDGSLAPAKLVAADPSSDIAVIKVDKTGLTPIAIGSSSNLAVGQDVVAIGSPLGLSGTVTSGIISSLNRPVSTSGNTGDQASVIDAIQTDAAINPGNSGGALVNMNGELIGVNTAIATMGGNSQSDQSGSIGLGFAIPVDQAHRISTELMSTGKATKTQIGISVPSSSTVNGAEIFDVVAGGPAAEAGLAKGEVITKVDSRAIDSGDALIAAIRSHAPGDKVQVTVTDAQGSNAKTVEVTLAAAPN